MTELTHLPADAGAEAIAQELLKHGGVILDGLLSQELIASINRDVDPLLARADASRHQHQPGHRGLFWG